MAEAIFAALVVLCAMVAIKVDQWYIISRLGFKSYTPLLFLESPRTYYAVSFALFAAALIALFFSTAISLYVGVVVLGAVWLGAFWIGRKIAFNTYRQIHREMIEYEDTLRVSDPSEYARIVERADPSARRAELEEGARKTDRELVECVKLSIKLGI